MLSRLRGLRLELDELRLEARHLATFSAGHILMHQAEAELSSRADEERRARSQMEGWMKANALATVLTVVFEFASVAAFVWGGVKSAGAVWWQRAQGARSSVSPCHVA